MNLVPTGSIVSSWICPALLRPFRLNSCHVHHGRRRDGRLRIGTRPLIVNLAVLLTSKVTQVRFVSTCRRKQRWSDARWSDAALQTRTPMSREFPRSVRHPPGWQLSQVCRKKNCASPIAKARPSSSFVFRQECTQQKSQCVLPTSIPRCVWHIHSASAEAQCPAATWPLRRGSFSLWV